MNYPVWDVPFLGSGLVVAIIAIIHMLISHFAIGGGALLFAAEVWAEKQTEKERILEWLHKFATFFLITTTVLGAVTGVAIWFAIQLAGPEATSLLIHQFVFVWALEWIAFLAELTVLYLYYYGWKTNSRAMQIFLAGAYFVIAWSSLFAINGIICFMLTPGSWTPDNPDIVSAFFNASFLPSLFTRTVIMLMLGGLFGILVASRIKQKEFKEKIVVFCARWVVPAAIGLPFFLYWYWSVMPENTIELVKGGVAGLSAGNMEIITRYLILGVSSSALIVLGTAVFILRPQIVSTLSASCLILIALLGIAGGEFFREMARKPYVIYGHLYSNSLWKKNAEDPAFLKKSFLDSAKWHPRPEPLSLDHGEWVYRLQCANCHTREGYRSLKERTADWTPEFGIRWLEKMEEQGVMPPFVGDVNDRAALTAYLLSLSDKEFDMYDVLEDLAGEAEESLLEEEEGE